MVDVTDISSAGSIPISAITGDPVARVPADATVADVARAMVTCDVGAIVIGDDARPAALVSERDIVRVVAAGRRSRHRPGLRPGQHQAGVV